MKGLKAGQIIDILIFVWLMYTFMHAGLGMWPTIILTAWGGYVLLQVGAQWFQVSFGVVTGVLLMAQGSAVSAHIMTALHGKLL